MQRLGSHTGFGHLAHDDTAIVSSAANWTIDPTSGIACPANQDEVAALLSAAGLGSTFAATDFSAIYNCQDASTQLTDTGPSGINLGEYAAGVRKYHQTQPGWARFAVHTAKDTSGGWGSTSNSLPDLTTTSAMMLVFAETVAGHTNHREAARIGDFMGFRITAGTTPRFQTTVDATTIVLADPSTPIPLGVVHPFLIRHDITNSRQSGYTDYEKINSPWDAITSSVKRLLIGSGAEIHAVWACLVTGASAERNDSDNKALLQAFNWNVTWS